jgi:hypothetical protein
LAQKAKISREVQLSDTIDFKDLQIGETFMCPYDSSQMGYTKTASNKGSYPAVWKGEKETYFKDFSERAICMRVELDENGKPILPPPYDHQPIEDWVRGNLKGKLPANWNYYGKRVSWEKAKMTIQAVPARARTTKYYDVILDEGEWPSTRAIMMICDGNVPTTEGHPGHFGGGVTFSADGKKARVAVHID